jgi:hypothetical protein
MSLDRFSKQFGVSRTLVVNNENGIYANPSPVIIDAFEQLDRWDESVLREYHLWQRETRRRNYGVLAVPLPSISSEQSDLTNGHPVVAWASYSNIPYNRISKLYCVHQGLMDRLKNQPNLMSYLPPAFTDALIDSGYSFEIIDELESRFQAYKHNARCKVVGVTSGAK